MERIIAFLVSGYGVYYLYEGNQVGMTPVEAMKGVAIIAIGLYYVIKLNYSFIISLIDGFKNKQSKVTVDITQPLPTVYIPVDYEKKDFECLAHLRRRVTLAHSKDGMETLAKLNDIIFNLDIPKEDTVEVISNEKKV